MTGYLLDTNVISEMTKSAPDAGVVSFLAEHKDFWLPSVAIHEMEFGVRILPEGRRRRILESDVARLISRYENYILPLERRGAEWAAEFSVRAYRTGRSTTRASDLADALIAGTAKAHDLAVVTRNTKDFELFDVEVINPWEAS